MFNWIAIGIVTLACLSYRSHLHENSIAQSFSPYKIWWTHSNADLVVIIPGLDGCTSFFSDSIPFFTAQYNVVMFNIPLSGPTLNVLRKFHVYREDSVEYSFESIADRLFDTINSISKEKQFTGKIYVIGESFGGFIAQVYAAKYQSKESRLEKLVLLSALAKTELTFSVEMKKRFALPIVKALGLIYPRLAQYVFAVVHQFDVVESSEPQYLFDFFVREASAAHHFSVMRRLELAISADISNSSSSISIPTLLIYGKDDQFTQHGTRHLSQLLQTSKSIGIPGGHLAHISNPELFSLEIISFFNSN